MKYTLLARRNGVFFMRFTKDTLRRVLVILLGAAICSFGVHNIHHRVSITEGGVMGLMLLLNNWFGISLSGLTPVLDLACYALAFKYLGKDFIKWSAFATISVSAFYKLWESLPFLLPDLSQHLLLSAVLGGMFVGIGVGLIVRQGGSSGGDDALALTISKVSGWRLSRSYLFTDITVLILSMTYIPLRNIGFSLITVTISSMLIDYVQNAAFFDKKLVEEVEEVCEELAEEGLAVAERMSAKQKQTQ